MYTQESSLIIFLFRHVCILYNPLPSSPHYTPSSNSFSLPLHTTSIHIPIINILNHLNLQKPYPTPPLRGTLSTRPKPLEEGSVGLPMSLSIPFCPLAP